MKFLLTNQIKCIFYTNLLDLLRDLFTRDGDFSWTILSTKIPLFGWIFRKCYALKSWFLVSWKWLFFFGKWYSVLSSSECEQMSLFRLLLESRVNGDLIYGIGQVLSASFTLYIRTVSSQWILSALLNWIRDCLGRATCTVHSVPAQTSQEGIKCTKTKEQPRGNSILWSLSFGWIKH